MVRKQWTVSENTGISKSSPNILTVITLNVNALSSPTKRYKVAECI